MDSIFCLNKVVSATDIVLSARCENVTRQLLAFVTGCGRLTLCYNTGKDARTVVKILPWFQDSSKRIVAMDFDPSGTWLLVAGRDGSLCVVPALSLVAPTLVLDRRWSSTDVTVISPPSPCVATAVVWWHCHTECHHVAVSADNSGDITFTSLTEKRRVGATAVGRPVTEIEISQGVTIDAAILLIMDDTGQQWRLLLEQRSTGFVWPLDNFINVNDAKGNESSGSHSSLGVPTARSRLHGLKQLSVEKLAGLRQRLAETRNRGGKDSPERPRTPEPTRRGSSSSSGDERTGVAGDKPAPEQLAPDTVLLPQKLRHKIVLTALYRGKNIVTVHAAGSVDAGTPSSAHKLATHVDHRVLLTDRFLFVTDQERLSVVAVATACSECRPDGDSEPNPDAILGSFQLCGDERIIGLYRLSDHDLTASGHTSNHHSGSSRKSQRKEEQPRAFSLPSSVAEIDADRSGTDTCVVVTTAAVYHMQLRRRGVELFLELLLEQHELERAERLAQALRLDMQRLLEAAGDLELGRRRFQQAVALYKLSRCRHLKSALKLAATGDSAQLLNFVGDLLTTASADELSPSERIHLANLAVMAHADVALRAGHKQDAVAKFTSFLSSNQSYDQVLAVNVAGQTRMWRVLRFLSTRRGLYPELLDVLARVLPSLVDSQGGSDHAGLDDELWTLCSDRALLPALLWKPRASCQHLAVVRSCLAVLPRAVLRRLATALDPTSPGFRPTFRRMLKTDANNEDRSYGAGSDIVLTYLLVLCHLVPPPPFSRRYLHTSPDDSGSKLPSKDSKHSESDTESKMQEKHILHDGRLLDDEKKDGDCNFIASNAREKSSTKDVRLCTESKDGDVKSAAVKDSESYVASKIRENEYKPGDKSTANVEMSLKNKRVSDDVKVSEDGGGRVRGVEGRGRLLAAGFAHAALVRNAGVYTWGSTQHGCLGTGATVSRHAPAQHVQVLAGLRVDALAVSAGRQHTLALTDNGVFAWGSNRYGQLGVDGLDRSPWPVPVAALADETVVQVAAGQYHSLALTAQGRVYAWGWAIHGQVGVSIDDVPLPRVVPLPLPCVAIAAGHAHSLALANDGSVYAFGSSMFGQLGYGSTTKQSRPVRVEIGENIVAIATSYFHNLALGESGSLYTWGLSPQSLRLQVQAHKKQRLLNKHAANQAEPVEPLSNHAQPPEPSANEDATSTPLADQEEESKAKEEESTDKGEGKRKEAELSPGKTKKSFARSLQDFFTESPSKTVGEKDEQVRKETRPKPACGETEMTSVATVKPPHKTDGDERETAATVSVTNGDHFPSQLEKSAQVVPAPVVEENTQSHLVPSLVDTSLVTGRIVQISTGGHHSALVTDDGSVYTWGRNLEGQLGCGGRREVPRPTRLSTLDTAGSRTVVAEVACGSEFTLALTSSRAARVLAWGCNSSAQLGKPPSEEGKALDGKVVMIRTMRRVIKLPHGANNAVDMPREVGGLPGAGITFRGRNRRAATSALPPVTHDATCLHRLACRLHGRYDATLLVSACHQLQHHHLAGALAELSGDVDGAVAYHLRAVEATFQPGATDSIANPEKDLITFGSSNEGILANTSEKIVDLDTIKIMSGLVEECPGRSEAKTGINDAILMSEICAVDPQIVQNVTGDGSVAIFEGTSQENSSVLSMFEHENVLETLQDADVLDITGVEGILRENRRNSKDIIEVDSKCSLGEVLLNVENVGREAQVVSAAGNIEGSVLLPQEQSLKGNEVITEDVVDGRRSKCTDEKRDRAARLDGTEMHAFSVQGGTEEMSEGGSNMTTPSDSPTRPITTLCGESGRGLEDKEGEARVGIESSSEQCDTGNESICSQSSSQENDIESKHVPQEEREKSEEKEMVAGKLGNTDSSKQINANNLVLLSQVNQASTSTSSNEILVRNESEYVDNIDTNLRESESNILELETSNKQSKTSAITSENLSETLNEFKESSDDIMGLTFEVSRRDTSLLELSVDSKTCREDIEPDAACDEQSQSDACDGKHDNSTQSVLSQLDPSIQSKPEQDVLESIQCVDDGLGATNKPQREGSTLLPVHEGSSQLPVHEVSPPLPVHEDEAALACEVMQHYLAQDSASMEPVLRQALDYWRRRGLPPAQLEALLEQHAPGVYYALAAVLFSEHQDEGPGSMLGRFSTQFCLKVCSYVTSHIDRGKPHSEFVALLRGLNGCSTSAAPAVPSVETSL